MSTVGTTFAFTRSIRGPISDWRGLPDCQSAHNYLHQRLNFVLHGRWLPRSETLNQRRKGNLGEFVAWCIGQGSTYSTHYAFPANAFDPLSNISVNGIDIVWLFMPDAEDQNDCAVILESKTTTASSTEYVTTVVDDFDKLFGTDPAFTLQSRLQHIKNRLEFSHRRKDLCTRVDALAATTPADCHQITLLPTVIHDLSSTNPDTDLLAVRSMLRAKGWDENKVLPWAVAFNNLGDRLERLSHGDL